MRINRLLNDGKDAWMLKATNNMANIGDFVVKKTDIPAKLTADNKLLGNNFPLYVELSPAGDNLPVNAVKLKKPKIALGRPNLQMDYILDILDFDGMRGERPNATAANIGDHDVYIQYGSSFDNGRDAAIIAQEIPTIFLGRGGSDPNNNNFLPINRIIEAGKRLTGGYQDRGEAVLKAGYSDNSLITTHMDKQHTTYTNTAMWVTNVPEGSGLKPLATVSNDVDFFKAGWWYAGTPGQSLDDNAAATQTAKNRLKGTPVILSGVYEHSSGKSIPMTFFTDYVIEKGQNQLPYRLIANAVFAYAAGIEDGQASEGDDEIPAINPEVGDITALLAAIANARGNLASVSVSTNGSDIATNSYWVTQAIKTAYEKAIKDAEDFIKNNPGASEAEIAEAFECLANATNAFNSAKALGTKSSVGGNGSGSRPSAKRSADVETVKTGPKTTPLTPIEPIKAEDIVMGIPFVDVSASDWFANAVMWAYEEGLMVGVSEDRFGPNMTLTRGMVATALWRLEGSPEASGTSTNFTDVAAGSWYEKAVRWAAENEIVYGYGDGLFGPNDNITRQDMAAMLDRFAKFAEIALPELRDYQEFNDEADIAAYAKVSVVRFFRATIINGKPGNIFDPRGNATRAEFATMMKGFLEAAK